MVSGGCDPAPEAWLLAGAGRRVGGGPADGLYLAGHLKGLPLVHDEDGLEPLGEPGVSLDGVGVGSTLQELDLQEQGDC